MGFFQRLFGGGDPEPPPPPPSAPPPRKKRGWLAKLFGGKQEPPPPPSSRPPRIDSTPGDDPGSGYNSTYDVHWRIARWLPPGGNMATDWKDTSTDKLTLKARTRADKLVIAATTPDGRTVYRTFTGPTADIDRVIDYWFKTGSL